MATVYLAHDLRHDRPVALKVLHPDLVSTLGPERFLQEIRTTARLQHPHILPVLDSGQASGLLWFTMPFVEGESLRERLRRSGELPIEEAVRLLRDVIDALGHAHAHGVLHRDIKPDNILVSGHHAVVADFGVAKALRAAGETSTGTTTGLVLGTPAYMAPEQAAGDSQVDHRADIYAFGVTAYEMLGGQPPFTGATPQALLAAHIIRAPAPLASLRPSIPPSLAALVMRCLEKRPADRWQSAEAILQNLEGLLTPSGGAEPIALRRPKRLVAAGGAVIAVVAGAVGILSSKDGIGVALDDKVVAVAPFDVLDPELALWREGMVDVLSRNLDGAGPLRTIAPTTVIRRWSGRADPASGTELGRRTAARYVVLGSLTAEGSDSARVAVTVLDASTGRPLAEFERRDAQDRMNRLADSTSVTVLRELGRSGTSGLSLTSVGTTSLPALKAFLQGEQHYRQASWDSALAAYERAIRLDSTFALALQRTAKVMGWLRSFTDTLPNAYLLRAGALNRGLSPRDSLLLLQDSLFAVVAEAFYQGRPDEAYWARLQRLETTAEAGVRRYPEDRELWEALGEVRYHLGFFLGVTLAQVAEPFERALTLDPSFAPLYIHPIELGLRREGPAKARQYASDYLRLNPTDQNANWVALVDRLLSDSLRRTGTTSRMLDTSSADALLHALIPLSFWPDSAETGVLLARLLVAGREGRNPLAIETSFTRLWLGSVLSHRGHLAEAYETGGAALHNQALLIELGLLGGIPPESVNVALLSKTLPILGGLQWWAARDDTLRISAVLRTADSLRRARPGRDTLITALGALAFGPVARALTRRDTTAALTAALAFPDSLCLQCWTLRWLRARLLQAHGRHREALALLDQHIVYPPSAMHVMLALERARVAERLGAREKSLESYQLVADAWRKADPGLQIYVSEAKAGMARLTSEPQK